MRPRCCLRYLTFFGINMRTVPRSFQLPASGYLPPPSWSSAPARGRAPARRPVILFTADPRRQALALVEPHLHPDLPVGRARLGKAVVDVGAQRLERQLPVQVPLGAGDLGTVQAARHAHLDAAGA